MIAGVLLVVPSDRVQPAPRLAGGAIALVAPRLTALGADALAPLLLPVRGNLVTCPGSGGLVAGLFAAHAVLAPFFPLPLPALLSLVRP